MKKLKRKKSDGKFGRKNGCTVSLAAYKEQDLNKETELLVNDVSSGISRAISSFLPFFLHICSSSLFGSTP